MSNLRIWILLLAVVSFLSGTAAGIVYSEGQRPAPTDRGPFSDYERLLSERFDLSPEVRQDFQRLLDVYDYSRQRIRDRHTAEYLSGMEGELRDLGIFYRGLIRNHVLPDNRRPEFDALCADFVEYRME